MNSVRRMDFDPEGVAVKIQNSEDEVIQVAGLIGAREFSGVQEVVSGSPTLPEPVFHIEGQVFEPVLVEVVFSGIVW